MDNNNNNNKYKFNKETIELCKNFSFLKNNNIILEPYQIRKIKEQQYINELNQYKYINQEFKMPKEINDGESVNCILFYPKNYNHGDNGNNSTIPTIIFIHGGGFTLEGEKLLPTEIANRTNSLVVYPQYSLAPEIKFPIAIEQCYQVLLDCSMNKYNIKGMDCNDITIVGASAGSTLSISTTLLTKQRTNAPTIKQLVLVYPITDNNFENDSYKEFTSGYYLTKEAMINCWNYYVNNQSDTDNPLCCPSKSTDQQLLGLPPTLIITSECDILRDEGEQFAQRLSNLNHNVSAFRVNSSIHGYILMNLLKNTNEFHLTVGLLCQFILNNKMEYNNLINNNDDLILKLI